MKKGPGAKLTTKDQRSTSFTSAILLAAGRSERMGAFKPLLPFGNTSVIQSCINYLRAGSVDEIIVVAGHRADEVRAELANSAVKIALNDVAHSEMNVSLARGAKLVSPEADCLLIALVDHPAVTEEVVTTLLDQWRKGSRLVVPTWNQRGGHPVLLDISFLPELLDLDPQRGLKALFETHRARVNRVPLNTPYVARDMDTWDDYRALHEEVFGYAPPELKAS